MRGVAPFLVRYGWGTPTLPVHQLKNLPFALARAEALSLPDASLDVVLNTFLIDRVPDPLAAFVEWKRVLQPGGQVIAVTPPQLPRRRRLAEILPAGPVAEGFATTGLVRSGLDGPAGAGRIVGCAGECGEMGDGSDGVGTVAPVSRS